MRSFLLICCATLLPLAMGAQSGWCGADLARLSEQEKAAANAIFNRTKKPLSKSNTLDSVAITIHLVNSPGQTASDELTIEEVEQELKVVNQAFEPAGIHFFICGSPRNFQGRNAYNFTTGDELNELAYIPNTINIYFVNDLVTNNGQGLCGYAQFPFVKTPAERYVMMNKFCATDGATLTHELGHFYGLLHTHETRYGREFVNRSNCNSAGDRLCDTSADPNLGNPNYMSGCSYIGLATDTNGEKYNPPVSNFMSYSPAHCQFFFSGQQEELIRDVHLDENAYLTRNCNFYPDFALLQEQDLVTIRSDQDLQVRYRLDQISAEQGYNVNLKISLADAPDETGLLVYEERMILEPGQSSLLLSFDLDFPIVKGSGTYYLKAFIDADEQVIERTERNNLAITTIEVDNSGLRDQLIFPNPAGDQLKLFLRDADARRDLEIRIFRYDGRLIWAEEAYKTQEEFFRILDINQLQPGFYLLSVQFEQTEQSYTFKFFKK